MIEYGFVDNVDYTKIENEVSSQNRLRTYIEEDYIITLDMAKHLCMLQKNEIGMKFRNYFIDCEREMVENG